MKRTVFSLGLVITAGMGCGLDENTTECQPGDIDCFDETAGGKADEWDGENDPRRLANSMQYRLAELPKTGRIEKHIWRERFPNAPQDMNKIWAESYFPSNKGSTNWRWISASEKSPLEKYDAAFNNAPGAAMQPAEKASEKTPDSKKK